MGGVPLLLLLGRQRGLFLSPRRGQRPTHRALAGASPLRTDWLPVLPLITFGLFPHWRGPRATKGPDQ